jgi:hypothetical protein
MGRLVNQRPVPTKASVARKMVATVTRQAMKRSAWAHG